MKDIKFLSYNIRKSVGLDWKRDPERIFNIVSQSQADIIALQEVDKRFGSREASFTRNFIEENSDYQVISSPIHKNSIGFHGNVLFARKAFIVESIFAKKFPALEPRGLIGADILITNNSNVNTPYKVRFIGVHLALLRYWRKKQIRVIDETYVNNDLADLTVIAGDFNEIKQKKSYFEHLISKPFELVQPGNSFHTSLPFAPFDKFITIGEGYRIKDYGILKTKLTQKASDHLPIYMSLEI